MLLEVITVNITTIEKVDFDFEDGNISWISTFKTCLTFESYCVIVLKIKLATNVRAVCSTRNIPRMISVYREVK